MNNPVFHDANVLGVEYQGKSKSLSLKIQFSNKDLKTLTFNQVYDFSVDGFSSQNILFDIVQYGKNQKPLDEFLMQFPSLSPSAIAFVKNNGFIAYAFEPSAGMTGYVIAMNYTIST